jgi:hypothetical protein
MRLRDLVRKLKFGLAGIVGGFAFACSGPTNPGEMPPMAPRPEPVQPMPSHDPNAPVPGSPDPIKVTTPDAGAPVTSMPSPKLESSHEDSVPMQKPPADAGVQDAVAMPPVPDSLPSDANKRADQAAFSCC